MVCKRECSAPEYIKIPNVPGLYRHARSGRYYGVKTVNEKRRKRSLNTTDRRIAEARLREQRGCYKIAFFRRPEGLFGNF